MDVSLQFSSTLSRTDASHIKSALSLSNVKHWATWALSPKHPCLAEINFKVVDHQETRLINLEFRGQNHPTNVLTFNAQERDNPQADVLLCAEVLIEESVELGISLKAHCAHLVIHATLHAQGYEHEHDHKKALEMEALESLLMLSLGFKNPYWD